MAFGLKGSLSRVTFLAVCGSAHQNPHVLTMQRRPPRHSMPTRVVTANGRRGRAPPGAKKRATVALIGNKATAAMTDAQLYAFWSAATMKIPPPLRTSFGNYTVCNVVERYTFTTATALNSYLFIPWSNSQLAALFTNGTSNSYLQLLYEAYTNNAPQVIRPLRMSFSLENLTTEVNTGGQVRVYSFDNAIQWLYTTGAVPLSVANGPYSGGTYAAPTGDSDNVWGNLVSSAPETEEVTVSSLSEEREWVSVPSSYPLYNAYQDFIPLTNTTDATFLNSLDAFNLFNGYSTPSDSYTAASLLSTSDGGSTGVGGIPPMRGFILMIPPTPIAQSIRISLHRQDGCRFPVNSIAHSFSHTPQKMSAQGEDKLLGLVAKVSALPGRSMLRSAVAAATTAATMFQDGLELSGALSAAKALLPAASTMKNAAMAMEFARMA
jgi:hypothetical protein